MPSAFGLMLRGLLIAAREAPYRVSRADARTVERSLARASPHSFRQPRHSHE